MRRHLLSGQAWPALPGANRFGHTQAEFARMAEALPNITAMVASEIHQLPEPTMGWCDSQTEFEFTLDLLLDGLERLREQTDARRETEPFAEAPTIGK